MFYRFPHEDVGFSEEEWDEIPRTDKVIIRDYFLHQGDKEQTMLYGYYETDKKVRRAVRLYGLRERPTLQISLACFNVVGADAAYSPTRWR